MSTTSRSRTPLVLGIVIAIAVALAAGVVIIRGVGGDDPDVVAPGASGGDDDGGAGTGDTGVPAGGSSPFVTSSGSGSLASGGPVFPAVAIDGEPLAELTDPNDDPARGVRPPTLTGSTYAGEPITIEPGAEGPMMVVFLAHWCPHCNDEIPVLLEWRDAGMIPDDLTIIGVSTGADENQVNFPPSQWLVDKGWDWPAMGDSADGAAARAYGLTVYPFLTIIGADGTVKLRTGGEIPLETLDTLVDEALA